MAIFWEEVGKIKKARQDRSMMMIDLWRTLKDIIKNSIAEEYAVNKVRRNKPPVGIIKLNKR